MTDFFNWILLYSGYNIFSILKDAWISIFHPWGTGRVGLTVAENAQPYLVDWINQNYPQVPLTYHIHNYGHFLPPALLDSMLIWADEHFKDIIPGIDDFKNPNMKNFNLFQNYPNPFNPSTNLAYQVQTGNAKAVSVELDIYNTLGQKVTTLVSQRQAAGRYEVQFNADGLPSGMYIYRLICGDQMKSGKMILMK